MTSIITNVIVLGIELGVFVLIFRQFPAIYEPRAFLTPLKEDRVDQLPKSLWRWAIAIWKADSKDIISKNGLDSYMFLRFLNLMLRIFIPFWIISWLLLIPIDVTGGGTQKGLYRLTFGSMFSVCFISSRPHRFLWQISGLRSNQDMLLMSS